MKKYFTILPAILFAVVLASCGLIPSLAVTQTSQQTSPSTETVLAPSSEMTVSTSTTSQTTSTGTTPPSSEMTVTTAPTQKPDWVTVVVAFNEYHEGEYQGVADALSDAGYAMVVVSTQTGTARGMKGGKLEISQTIDEIEGIGLGIIIVGGTGITREWENQALIALVQAADAQGKLVAAICAGPGVLANAGVLEGKQACWYDGPNTNAVMAKAGCVNSGLPVTIDGNAVTGNGPSAAKAFGQAIVSALNS